MARPSNAYHQWLRQLKERIRSSQIKAALKVNTELLNLYWDLGKEIIEKETNSGWGDKLVELLAKDLLKEFPYIKGFSRRNLFYIRRFVDFWAQSELVQQPVALIDLIAQQPVGLKQKRNALKKSTKKPTKKLPKVVAKFKPLATAQMPTILTTIPWGHHIQIITKCKYIQEALYYISKTTQHNNWSRSMLVHQMERNLYK